jgi:AcrR family transcriptional regulator
MRALTIGELEQESGVPRQTIYYYLRTGLLPPSQKASRSRALYDEDHLALVKEIEDLRSQGLRHSVIRTRLASRTREAGANDVDLVAQKEEETRQAILVAATLMFARKGYKGTRMADLIEELDITPQALYGYFATKQELFVACYKVAVSMVDGYLAPMFEEARDEAERQIWGMHADTGIKVFAPTLMMLAHEAATHDEAAKKDLLEAYNIFTRPIIADLRGLRRSDQEPPFSDELMTHAIIGAFEQMWARASLDDEFSVRDIMRTSLGVFLAISSMYEGQTDVAERMARYEDLLTEVAELPTPVLEDLKP